MLVPASDAPIYDKGQPMPKSIAQFDAAAHFNEDLAVKYDRRIRSFCPSYDALHQMLAPCFMSLPENASFLSAGAGTGAEVLALGKQFPTWRFVAADASSDMLKACRYRVAQSGMADRVTFFDGRLQDLKSPAPFDAASSIFVSHFIKSREEKSEYFRSIATNLRPGGLLILADLFGDRTTPEFGSLFRAWLTFYASHGASAEELAQDQTHIERDISFVSESELIAQLVDVGFAAPIRFYQTYLFGGWLATKSID